LNLPGEGPTIIAEDFDFVSYRGWIAQGRELGSFRPAIDENVHMSYPYAFECGGEAYCIPESAGKNGVWLYRWDTSSRRWVVVAELIRDFPALDATVLCYGGKWWLFCTHAQNGPDTHLHVWHASSFMGPWEPHRGNPVKVDIRSSRPAGTPFVHAGQLYRPAQNSADSYGVGITINRVTQLTEAEFCEEPATEIRPFANSGRADGVHTLSTFATEAGADTSADMIVVDAKRMELAPSFFVRRMLHKFKRLGQVLGG
jgi:hypothetical protein